MWPGGTSGLSGKSGGRAGAPRAWEEGALAGNEWGYTPILAGAASSDRVARVQVESPCQQGKPALRTPASHQGHPGPRWWLIPAGGWAQCGSCVNSMVIQFTQGRDDISGIHLAPAHAEQPAYLYRQRRGCRPGPRAGGPGASRGHTDFSRIRARRGTKRFPVLLASGGHGAEAGRRRREYTSRPEDQALAHEGAPLPGLQRARSSGLHPHPQSPSQPTP